MRMLIGVAVLLCGCGGGKSGEEQAKEEEAAEKAREPKVEPAATKQAGTLPVDAAPPDAAEPEPTTPAEIDKARNAAMLAQKPKEVLKYCDLGKLDDKSNPQTLLGCTLAACQLKDDATAKKYAQLYAAKKDFMAQAKKVCLANGVAL